MYRGVYTAAMGMLVDLTKIDTLSNNLANVETNGYKEDTLAFKTHFEKAINSYKPEPENKRVKVSNIGVLPQAVILDEVKTTFTDGVYEETRVNTHLALSGNGFFKVQRGNQTLYTRNGEFIVNRDGYLVNTQGEYVLDSNNNRIVFPENGSIDEQGNILDGFGNLVGTIAVVGLDSPRKVGYNNFVGQEIQPGEFRILTGFVEKSNVNAVREMVKLIEAHRHYDITSKSILVHDELLNKVINNVGTLR